jgi:hypothetical protein
VERSVTNITLDNLKRITGALGVDPQTLLANPDAAKVAADYGHGKKSSEVLNEKTEPQKLGDI